MVQNSHMMQIRAIPPRSPSGLSESIFALGASLYQVCLNHIYPWVIFINRDSVLGEKFGKEVKVGGFPNFWGQSRVLERRCTYSLLAAT